MPGAVGTNVIKDGNAAAIVGGVRMFDVSGTGAGPWVPMSMLTDASGNQLIGQKTMALSLPVAIANDQTLPLPAGAATDANITTVAGAAGTSPPALAASASGNIGWLRKIVDTLTAGIGVTGTFWQATQPVSGTISLAPSTTDVSITPAVTASAYTAGNVIGGIMTFASILAATSFNGVLHSITAKFKGAAVTGSLEIAIFKASPSNGTYTDKTAPTWNASDMANLLGVYTLAVPNSKLGTMTVYNLDAIGKAIVGASQSLYVVAIVDGTPTPASTSDFTLELAVLPG